MTKDPLTDQEAEVCRGRVAIHLSGDAEPAATEPCTCPARHPEEAEAQ